MCIYCFQDERRQNGNDTDDGEDVDFFDDAVIVIDQVILLFLATMIMSITGTILINNKVPKDLPVPVEQVQLLRKIMNKLIFLLLWKY